VRDVSHYDERTTGSRHSPDGARVSAARSDVQVAVLVTGEAFDAKRRGQHGRERQALPKRRERIIAGRFGRAGGVARDQDSAQHSRGGERGEELHQVSSHA
jgi:hypothetical protein